MTIIVAVIGVILFFVAPCAVIGAAIGSIWGMVGAVIGAVAGLFFDFGMAQ